MSIRRRVRCTDRSATLTATEMLGQLVSERAFVAAQELLSNLDAHELAIWSKKSACC